MSPTTALAAAAPVFQGVGPADAARWAAAASLAAWLWLLLAHGFFWRTDVRLPPRRSPDRWPSVAVLIPARNEAAVLPRTLPTLLTQDYPGRAEIFLIDDGSTDGTGHTAHELARRHPGGLLLTVGSSGEPEPGWTGKLWALRHGMALAGTRMTERGGAADFLLLTDADIAHAPDSLRELVRAAHGGGRDLVSVMARLRVATGWEKLLVPAFVFFFGQLYPFRRVNRPTARTAAAAGGCVLLRAETAARAGVPAAIRNRIIDDVALGQAVQRAGGRIWLGLADRAESVRPYPRAAQLWEMVTRSAYPQLRHNPLLLAPTVLGLGLVYLLPPAALAVGTATGATATAATGGAAWALMTASYVPMLRYYRLPRWQALLLPVAAALYLLMTVDSAIRYHRGQATAWKGRTAPRPGAAR